MSVRYVEGVPYRRYVARFKNAAGKRRQLTVWSPGRPWVGPEIARELEARIGTDEEVPPGATVVVRQEAPQ